MTDIPKTAEEILAAFLGAKQRRYIRTTDTYGVTGSELRQLARSAMAAGKAASETEAIKWRLAYIGAQNQLADTGIEKPHG